MPQPNHQPDRIFEGGDMDCGSGLILLIRQNMLEVPVGGILELRSTEPTVTVELPPWCRMVAHEYLESIEDSHGHWRHFVRRGSGDHSDVEALAADKAKAQNYEWRVRARHTAAQESSLYARNFSWKLGQPVSFEEKDDLPSSIEAALGALLAELLNGFASHCSRAGFVIDDLEGNLRATMANVLAHLDLDPGSPALHTIILTAFISSPASGVDLRQCWEKTLATSPFYQTLTKACLIEAKLAII